MKISLIIFFLSISFGVLAQIDPNSFEIPPTEAEMPSSKDEDYKYYLKKNLKYPKQASKMGVEGTVKASLTVSKNGILSDIIINTGIGAGCDQLVIDFLNNSPDWTPGSINGMAVPQKVEIHFIFSLKGKEVTIQKGDVNSMIEDYDMEGFKVYEEVDKPAEIKGGERQHLLYVKNNLRYPYQALRMGVEGKVFFEFIVEKDGSVSYVRVTRGIGAGCDEETIRLISEMPNWIPATKNGKPVRQKRTDSLIFKLGD